MIIRATGQLFHHFWGSYCATIGLAFGNPAEDQPAKNQVFRDENWKIGQRDPKVLVWSGDSEALDELKAQLAPLRLEVSVHPLTKAPMSGIDCGPLFTIEVEVNDPNQIGFAFADQSATAI